MPKGHRLEKIEDLIQRTLATLLQREAKDPRFSQVTITAVDVSPDLANAKVYITILDENNLKLTLDALNKAAGYLRHELAEKVELRITPSLRFYYDESLKRGNRIDKLLNDI